MAGAPHDEARAPSGERRVGFVARASTGFLAGAAVMSVLTCALVWQDNMLALAFDVVLAVLSLLAALLAARYPVEAVRFDDGGLAQHVVELVLVVVVALPVIRPSLVNDLVLSLRYWVRSL